MRKSLLAVAALVAAPLFAGDTGWYVGLGSSLASSGDNTLVLSGYSNSNPSYTGFGSNDRLSYDTDAGIHVWAGRKSEMGDVRFSYWSVSNEAEMSRRGTPGQQMYDIPFSMSGHYWDDFTVGSELKATQIDLTWSHELVSAGKFTADWGMGLRHWQVKRDLRVYALAYNGDSTFHSDDLIRNYSKADGIGFTGSLRGTYKFNDYVWLSAGMRMGFVTGKNKLEYREDENHVGTIGYYDFRDEKSDNLSRQNEFDVKVGFKIWRDLTGFAGYEFRQYDEALALNNRNTWYMNGDFSMDTTGVNFSGFKLGLNWAF